MKTLILDESKWICGNPSNNINPNTCRGKGDTSLLNKEGYMCCLGQFSLQLTSNVTEKDISGFGVPGDLDIEIPLLTNTSFGDFQTSLIGSRAIFINDNTKTTVEEKVKALKELFITEGYEIEFKPMNS